MVEQRSSDLKDMVVIGAGIVGLCSALRAQDQGFRVTLIDPDTPGSGCSRGNAGHFATEQVFPLADPAMLRSLPAMLLNPAGPLSIRTRYLPRALPWFARFLMQMRRPHREHNCQVLSQLCEQALPAWERLLDSLNLRHHLQQKGNLLVFERATPAQIEAQAMHYRGRGISLDLLDRDQLHAVCPGLSESVTAALWFKDTGHCADPFALSQALFRAFLTRGGHWLETGVKHITPGISHKLQLHNGATLMADTLLISAGIHSKSLCQQLDYAVPLEAERGYHLNTSPAAMPTMAVASYDRKFIMTPMNQGLRLAGTVEFAGLSAAPDFRRANRLFQHGCALWPALKQAPDPRQKENQWMGNRPSLPDSLPVISASRWHNLLFNFGHQHLGLTLAAVSADWLLELISNNKSPMNGALSIDRF